jgi:uncharacterized protein YqjF (DUF2071 family)
MAASFLPALGVRAGRGGPSPSPRTTCGHFRRCRLGRIDPVSPLGPTSGVDALSAVGGKHTRANVRTYVRGLDGRRGIWFFSLDASRLVAVLEARRSYRIPYMWARMRFRVTDEEARYRSRRRWPGPRGVGMDVRLRIGAPTRLDELRERDRFLICRWRLYSPSTNGLAVTVVEHDPWPIRLATPVAVEQNLLAAFGLTAPTELPIAHYSRGVETRFGPRVQLPTLVPMKDRSHARRLG